MQHLHLVEAALGLAAPAGAVPAACLGRPWQGRGRGQVVLVPVRQVRPLVVVVVVVVVSMTVQVVQGLAVLQFSATCAALAGHASGQLLFLQRFQVLSLQLRRRNADQRGGGAPEPPQPVPERQRLAVTLPGVVVKAQVLQGRQQGQGAAGKLRQGVIKQVEGGEAPQVVESLPVDPLDAVLVEKQAVQYAQTTEGVLPETPEPIAVQEEVAEVEEVDEQVVLQELQLVVLQ